MNIKKAYYYLFYSLYKFLDSVSIPKFWSDAKAVLTISVLELFIIYSLIIYYRLINRASHFGEGALIIVLSVLFIATPNFLIFIYSDTGKNIFVEFDKWPDAKKDKANIFVWGLIILIIANLIIACNITYD